MNPEQINLLKKHYPVGTRIELVEEVDVNSTLEQGEKGTITRVDSLGYIHINWDSGISGVLLYGIDDFNVIKK
mgnify:CR=1 FL=1